VIPDYKNIIWRSSYCHLTGTNEIRYFNPILKETFPANVFPGISFSQHFPETVLGRGLPQENLP